MKKLLLILCLLLSVYSAQATHLVGGEMTYVRLGGNSIRVTLIIYRDDYNGNPNALFDQPATISFYNDNGLFLSSITQPLTSQIDIDPILNPCQDAIPNVLTQRGVYQFDVNLNTINGFNPNLGTTLVYGRCCRNDIVDNLLVPEDQGFSSIVRVPPTTIQNNSPVFNNTVKQYLCAGRSNTVDLSATDVDGDSLYYSLCDPFLGLDNVEPIADNGNLNAGGTYPNYGPPYNTVIWDGAAGYSAVNPFNAPITISPNTGVIQVTPSQGFYVMAVCVSEYRNGQLLSTVMRDFQYLVSACDFPEAEIAYDPDIPQDPSTGFYTIDAQCNDGTVNFELSVDVGVSTYSWDFGDPTTTSDVSTQQEPSYFYSDTGSYLVTLIATAPDGCADTTYGLVVFYPIFTPGYTFIDSCQNFAVSFIDTSTTTTGNVDSWTWDFGDPSTTTDNSTQQFPSYIYGAAGTFNTQLTVTTDKGCQEIINHPVTVQPLPEPDFITPTPICFQDTIAITNTSSIQSGMIVSYAWDFGNGQTSSLENPPNQTYPAPGTYDINLIEISELGCTDTITNQVIINPLPVANTSGDSPICPFSDSQLNAFGGVSYLWSPANLLNSSTLQNPIASIDTTPTTFYVVVTDALGCSAMDSVFVDLFPLPPANAGEDTSVCLNAANVVSFNTTVDLMGSGGVSYVWSPGSSLTSTNTANTTANPTTNTSYTLTVTDANNCINYDTVDVIVLNPALELISVDVDSLCFGDTVYVDVLDQGGASIYAWSPASFLTDPSANEPGFFPPSNRTYELTVTNYCYQDKDTVDIEVVPLPALNGGALDSICLGDPPYQLNASPNDLELYLWTTTDPTISDPNIFNPTIEPTQDTWYYILAIDSVGSLACANEDSVLILVHNLPDLELQYPLDYPGYICLGDAVDLEAISFDGETYQWSANNGAFISSPTSSVTSVLPTDTTRFFQTVTNVHNCSTTDSMDVNVQLPVVASVTGDTIMCVGSYVDLEANGGLYYEWQPANIFSNTTNSLTQASPDSSVTVSVEVSNDCFLDTAYHTITVYQLPLVDAGEDFTMLRDEFDFLNGSGTGTPLWYTEDKTFDGLIDIPTIFNPEVSPFITTNYVLEITDPFTGCLNYDTMTVTVDVLTLLAFPTGFSPNGDGVNDFAHIIKYLNIEKLLNLSIYDRYGEEIFRGDELNTAWDGTFRGANVEIGVYMWVINAVTKDQETILRKGNITVIR